MPGQVGGWGELQGPWLRGEVGERQEIRKSSFYKKQKSKSKPLKMHKVTLALPLSLLANRGGAARELLQHLCKT